MDTARVVHHDTGSAPRPGGRRGFIVALALAAFAAPLASGSAIAITGDRDTSSAGPSRPSWAAPSSESLQQGSHRGSHCHHPESLKPQQSTGYAPEL